MKYVLIAFTLTLAACAQLTNSGGTAQSVDVIDYKHKVYKTTCSGLVDSWPDCAARARKTCEKGYEEIRRVENPTAVLRELTFQCKK